MKDMFFDSTGDTVRYTSYRPRIYGPFFIDILDEFPTLIAMGIVPTPYRPSERPEDIFVGIRCYRTGDCGDSRCVFCYGIICSYIKDCGTFFHFKNNITREMIENLKIVMRITQEIGHSDDSFHGMNCRVCRTEKGTFNCPKMRLSYRDVLCPYVCNTVIDTMNIGGEYSNRLVDLLYINPFIAVKVLRRQENQSIEREIARRIVSSNYSSFISEWIDFMDGAKSPFGSSIQSGPRDGIESIAPLRRIIFYANGDRHQKVIDSHLSSLIEALNRIPKLENYSPCLHNRCVLSPKTISSGMNRNVYTKLIKYLHSLFGSMPKTQVYMGDPFHLRIKCHIYDMIVNYIGLIVYGSFHDENETYLRTRNMVRKGFASHLEVLKTIKKQETMKVDLIRFFSNHENWLL
jgi:hypothetical protein